MVTMAPLKTEREVRCPRCGRLLIARLIGMATIYCRHCKEYFEVSR